MPLGEKHGKYSAPRLGARGAIENSTGSDHDSSSSKRNTTTKPASLHGLLPSSLIGFTLDEISSWRCSAHAWRHDPIVTDITQCQLPRGPAAAIRQPATPHAAGLAHHQSQDAATRRGYGVASVAGASSLYVVRADLFLFRFGELLSEGSNAVRHHQRRLCINNSRR